jgi:hypothetical protein
MVAAKSQRFGALATTGGAAAGALGKEGAVALASGDSSWPSQPSMASLLVQ